MIRINKTEETEWLSFLSRLTGPRGKWGLASRDLQKRIDFQRFGVELHEEDFKQEGVPSGNIVVRDRTETRVAISGTSEIQDDAEMFQATLDVWPFTNEELVVMMVPGLYVVIDGEHKDKSEDNSVCTRKFTRRYLLPEGCGRQVQMCQYREFTLTIRIAKEPKENGQEAQVVPIEVTQEKSATLSAVAEDFTEKVNELRQVPIIVDETKSDIGVDATSNAAIDVVKIDTSNAATSTDNKAKSDKEVGEASNAGTSLDASQTKTTTLLDDNSKTDIAPA